jgi:hypothetical protein
LRWAICAICAGRAARRRGLSKRQALALGNLRYLRGASRAAMGLGKRQALALGNLRYLRGASRAAMALRKRQGPLACSDCVVCVF